MLMETAAATSNQVNRIEGGLYKTSNNFQIESLRHAHGNDTERGFYVSLAGVPLEWFATKRDAVKYALAGGEHTADNPQQGVEQVAAAAPAVLREFVCVTAARDAQEFHVHGATCGDIKRGVRSGKYWELGRTETHSSADALVAEWVADFDAQDQGWSATDFKVFPCAK